MTFWTPQHIATFLPVTLIGFGIAVLLRLLIGRASLFVRLIPIQLLSIAFVWLEIEKQMTSLEVGYEYFHLPFHYCSLMLLFFPLAAFSFGKIVPFSNSISSPSLAATICFIESP